MLFKFLANSKLMTKLLLSYLILIIFPLGILALLSYNTISQAITDKTTYSAKQSFEQSYSYLSYKLRNVSNKAIQLTANKTLRSTISTDQRNYDENLELSLKDYKALYSYLAELENPDDAIRVRIYINPSLSFTANRQNIFSLNDVNNSVWYKQLQQNKDRFIWIPSDYFSGDNTYMTNTDLKTNETLSLGMKILHPDNYTVDVGVARFDFSKLSIVSILDNANSIRNSVSYLINSHNTVVAASCDTLHEKYLFSLSGIGENKVNWNYRDIENEKYLVGTQKIKNTDWYMVSAIPYSQITYDSRRILNYLLILLIIIVSVAYTVAFIISRSITKRVSKLAERMNNLRGGKLRPMSSSKSKDEVGVLIDNYNYMTEKMSELIEYQYKSGQELKNAELKTLQAQINPHFLYNTLDMINWYGQKSGSPEILSIVSSLTKFYRLSLSKGKDTISIKDELAHVESYFVIQNMRFQNKLNLVVDVPEEIINYQILKITLQPLVENSILHGIMWRESKSGTIIISGTMKDNTITILIKDDGVGISPEKLKAITDGTLSSQGSSFGVCNVNDRLKLYYGQEFGLAYESKEGEGTIVSITLPAKL